MHSHIHSTTASPSSPSTGAPTSSAVAAAIAAVTQTPDNVLDSVLSKLYEGNTLEVTYLIILIAAFLRYDLSSTIDVGILVRFLLAVARLCYRSADFDLMLISLLVVWCVVLDV